MVRHFGLKTLEVQSTSQCNDYNSELNKHVVVCDINPDMLAVGKDRSTQVLGREISRYVSFDA